MAGEWTLSGSNEVGQAISCPIAVPGDVHSALFLAGLIPDPCFGVNEANVLWVSKSDWTVRRSFVVDENLFLRRSVILRMENVDTFATIRVNGKVVGETCNRFRRWEFDVKRTKHYTTNSLDKFTSKYKAKVDSPIVLHTKDLSVKDGVTYFPLYMTPCL